MRVKNDPIQYMQKTMHVMNMTPVFVLEVKMRYLIYYQRKS